VPGVLWRPSSGPLRISSPDIEAERTSDPTQGEGAAGDPEIGTFFIIVVKELL
jgi:hypothetical protein